MNPELKPGAEVIHPQWGKGTVLFDKPHCIGIRFLEHGQVNFTQQEWAAQHSPPNRFRSTTDLEFSLQEAVDNMELTEDQALQMLRENRHPFEIKRLKRPSLLEAYQKAQEHPQDGQAQDEFYKALLNYITALVKRHSHDQATFSNIEDAIQDSAMEIWQRLPAFDPARSSIVAWVSLITTHNVRDALRRFRTDRGLPQRPTHNDRQPAHLQLDEEQINSKAMPVDLQYAIKEFQTRLPALDRTILQLAVDGLTLREIGESLALSHEGVRKRLKKMRLGLTK